MESARILQPATDSYLLRGGRIAPDAPARSQSGAQPNTPDPAVPASHQHAPDDGRLTKGASNVGHRAADAHSDEGARDHADQALVREFAQRDREVRAHEQAHAAIGGVHAGSPTYEFERGPNGVPYAVSGHVNIDVSKVPGDPEATLEKAQVVRRAALAPASPSAADRAVAARASVIEAEAQVELAEEQSRQLMAADPTQHEHGLSPATDLVNTGVGGRIDVRA